MSALKVSLGGRSGSELALEYEEFFLNNADDIADLLKVPKTTAPHHTCTHFQAQQMVCSMIQVGGASPSPSPGGAGTIAWVCTCQSVWVGLELLVGVAGFISGGGGAFATPPRILITELL